MNIRHLFATEMTCIQFVYIHLDQVVASAASNNGVSEKVKISDIIVETTQHTLFLLYKSSDLYEVLEDQIEMK